MSTSTPQWLAVEVGSARSEQLPAVLALARRWRLGAVAGDLSGQGFLLAGRDLEHYVRYLAEAEHFYVATRGHELAGFLVAYDQRHEDLDPMLNRAVKAAMPAYLNIDQICVRPRWVRRGVGTQLWAHLFRHCGPEPIVVEIVSSPPNTASASLHRKLGFEPFINLVRPGGILTTVWLRNGSAR